MHKGVLPDAPLAENDPPLSPDLWRDGGSGPFASRLIMNQALSCAASDQVSVRECPPLETPAGESQYRQRGLAAVHPVGQVAPMSSYQSLYLAGGQSVKIRA